MYNLNDTNKLMVSIAIWKIYKINIQEKSWYYSINSSIFEMSQSFSTTVVSNILDFNCL